MLLRPKVFPGLLDRQTETTTLIEAIKSQQSIECTGESGVGRTSLLRHLAHQSQLATVFPAGVVYFQVNQQSVSAAPPSRVTISIYCLVYHRLNLKMTTRIATAMPDAQEAPPAEKDKALERVDELQEAVMAREPDLTTMEYVRNWFVKNLPSVAGSVVSLIVHPLVGKLVEVGGEAISTTFRKRFGIGKN